MAKKTFLIMLAVLLTTFVFSAILRYGRLSPGQRIEVDRFPLTKGDWSARPLPIDKGVLAMLGTDAIFSARYSNGQGEQVELFFSYFAGDNAQGGVHSPLNCMPGSGWTIESTEMRNIPFGAGTIPASRLYVRYGSDLRVVDYWYITRHDETSSDYKLKLFAILSALSFQPSDIAFVRFIGSSDPAGVSQLDAFEREFVGDIYDLLPFGKVDRPGL